MQRSPFRVEVPGTSLGFFDEEAARFDQVEDVSDTERDEAWKRIQSAAKKFGVEVHEKSWHELGKKTSHH